MDLKKYFFQESDLNFLMHIHMYIEDTITSVQPSVFFLLVLLRMNQLFNTTFLRSFNFQKKNLNKVVKPYPHLNSVCNLMWTY